MLIIWKEYPTSNEAGNSFKNRAISYFVGDSGKNRFSKKTAGVTFVYDQEEAFFSPMRQENPTSQ